MTATESIPTDDRPGAPTDISMPRTNERPIDRCFGCCCCFSHTPRTTFLHLLLLLYSFLFTFILFVLFILFLRLLLLFLLLFLRVQF